MTTAMDQTSLEPGLEPGASRANICARTRLPVAVAFGDGIGPEIMRATLRALEAAGAALDIREITIGEALYLAGHSSGIDEEAWEAIDETGLLFKAPITTPLGGGVKSLNVTLRKTLGLYANVRPSIAYDPYVPTLHPGMDVVVVRENEEDLYAGIEHRQTQDVYQCLKLVSRTGTERIVRYAFEYARANERQKVTAVTKSNIMKLTDGLFDAVFQEIGREYDEIEQERMIVDIAAAKLAADPKRFDVIVTGNLYGDILSDIAAEVAGSVGLAPSANIGRSAAMFEAIHGSAPDIAGQGIANPSGLLLAGCMMLRHAGQDRVADAIETAWRRTLADGFATPDLYRGERGRGVSTDAFIDAVIERIEPPEGAEESEAGPAGVHEERAPELKPARQERQLMGIDVFVQADTQDVAALARQLRGAEGDGMTLRMITNRGVQVWPRGNERTIMTDHWRCRFLSDDSSSSMTAAPALALRAAELGLDVVKTEQLYSFDGERGFSLGQGQ
jgi:isocitrate dehydrogenase